jgi:hypothetical protein
VNNPTAFEIVDGKAIECAWREHSYLRPIKSQLPFVRDPNERKCSSLERRWMARKFVGNRGRRKSKRVSAYMVMIPMMRPMVACERMVAHQLAYGSMRFFVYLRESERVDQSVLDAVELAVRAKL